MKKQLVQMMAVCASCLVIGAQAQAPQTPQTPGTTPGSSGALSATGRQGQQGLRASKLIGADVKSSQGESIGKIEDALINPFSGRIDFAVISSSSSGAGAGATSTTPGTPGATPGTSPGAGSEKLVPVPWSFLRSSSIGATPGTASPTSGAQSMSFVFTGDKSKLESAPSFDRNNWPDVSQSDWRQRIFSHFGMQPGSATGGAGTPGGTGTGGTGTSDPTSPTTPRPGTTPGTPPPESPTTPK